jgi:hypothetical protein
LINIEVGESFSTSVVWESVLMPIDERIDTSLSELGDQGIHLI